jgi:hypothetical protein
VRLPPASLVPAYLCVQALVVAAWWIVMVVSPAARAPFVVPGWPAATLFAFALPDALLLVAGSLAAAAGLVRQRAWARPLLWCIAGAALYATAWSGAVCVMHGDCWLPFVAMLPCCVAMGWAAWVVR